MGSHYSVLLGESIESLNVKEDGIYVDLTLGRAGHSREILRRAKKGKLYCFDLDEEAIGESKPILDEVGHNYEIIHSSFAFLKEELLNRGVEKVDGIIADLGVSSPQFDEGSRGFSYKEDAPLDMRMDQSQSLTAAIVCNTYPEEELRKILYEYGEERDAPRIAREILRSRPLTTTFDLVEAVKRAKSAKELSKKGHPAKQTFQAIRIEVNGEEKALQRMLEVAPSLLKPDGRLAIITFMSLDDRLVKRRFRELAVAEGDRRSIALLPEQMERKEFSLYSKKAILPSEKELGENRRSASAKLRCLIKNP